MKWCVILSVCFGVSGCAFYDRNDVVDRFVQRIHPIFFSPSQLRSTQLTRSVTLALAWLDISLQDKSKQTKTKTKNVINIYPWMWWLSLRSTAFPSVLRHERLFALCSGKGLKRLLSRARLWSKNEEKYRKNCNKKFSAMCSVPFVRIIPSATYHVHNECCDAGESFKRISKHNHLLDNSFLALALTVRVKWKFSTTWKENSQF